MNGRVAKKRSTAESTAAPARKRPRTGCGREARAPKQRRTFTWTGQFRPECARAYLDLYARPDSFVWDPFAGSGTVLYECAARGIRAHGTDVNPAAVTMATVASSCAWTADRCRRALDSLAEIVGRCVNAARATVGTEERDLLLAERPRMHADVAILAAALLCRSERTGGGATCGLAAAWTHFRAFVDDLPRSACGVSASLCDARRSGLDDASVDLVVTSPPYINVINYHQQYRALMERMGYRVLAAAPSEIGANRKHRSNRLLTIVQYCMDMGAVFDEMARVCKPTARVVMVVGRETNVLGVSIPNSRLVERIATEAGSWRRAAPTEQRSFTNRFGRTIVEDILHFAPLGGRPAPAPVAPVDLAVDALVEAQARAPQDKRALFAAAIAAAPSVTPSPVLLPTSLF